MTAVSHIHVCTMCILAVCIYILNLGVLYCSSTPTEAPPTSSPTNHHNGDNGDHGGNSGGSGSSHSGSSSTVVALVVTGVVLVIVAVLLGFVFYKKERR